MRKKAPLYNALFYLFVTISCSPLIVLIMLTISTYWPYPALAPEIISFDYLRHVFFGNRQTLLAVITTILLAFFVTFLSLCIAIPSGKAIGCYDFKGKSLVKLLVLLPLVMPSIAVITGIHVTMIRAGLTGNYLGVALIQTLFAMPYSIRIMVNVFEIIGRRLEQQATVLGAGTVMIFQKVTLPRLMPAILSAGALSFTVSVAQYITTFIIGGGRIITVTMLIVPHIQSREHHTAAVYSILLIASALLSLFMVEKLVRRYYKIDDVFGI